MNAAFRQYLDLCGGLLYWLFVAPFRGRGWRMGHTFSQIIRIGVHAVPMTSLTALTIGVVLAMQSAAQLAKMGATVFVPGLVSSSLVRELAPLVTAVIVIGRSGSAVTAELGTMKVSEEIEALEVMAISPMSWLIIPRFLAMVIMLPLLTVFSIYVGLAGGWLIGHFSLHMSTAYFVNHALHYVALRDVGISMLKSGVFGVLIITIASSIGLNVSGGAEGVGLATTRSVVVCLLSVFIANALLTALFFF